MPTIQESEIEAIETRISELEAELSSYIDDLAEMTQRAESAESELRRIRAAYPDVA